MKTIALSLIASAAVTGSVFAGQQVSHKEFKQPAAEPCFKDTELQVDIFGTWTYTPEASRYEDGFGGGVGVNYFVQRYFGVGVDGQIYDGGANGVWDVTGRLIARYPIELGTYCLAPYAFGGGGIQADSTTSGTWHAGAGLEWRATQKIGVFGESRYTWGAQNDDAYQARLGVRFAF
jgi:hypothetical protein